MTTTDPPAGDGPFRVDARYEHAHLLWRPDSNARRHRWLHPAYMVAIPLVTLVSLLWWGPEDSGRYIGAFLALVATPFMWSRRLSAGAAVPVPCLLGPEGIRCDCPDRTSVWSFDLVRSVVIRRDRVEVGLSDGELLELRPTGSTAALARWIRSRSPALDAAHDRRQLALVLLYAVLCPATVAWVAHLTAS